MNGGHRIRILPPETARKIAAGEVVDKPAALVRELLDNALDSGARHVVVEIEGGGIGLVRVMDDGDGMDQEDLGVCVLDHATSKIADIDDLLSLTTLGFRGEALASIAAVARLEIVSAPAGGEPYRLVSRPSGQASLEPWRGRKGTTVTVEELFAEIPARRKFLSRAGNESASCRQVFIDKALTHPDTEFRFVADGAMTMFLPAASQFDRIMDAYAPTRPPEGFFIAHYSGDSFSGSVVAGDPSFARTDRRAMQVFINRRRIQEFSIQSALDDGYSGWLPGGLHPEGWILLDVDPAEADFNIHPAKRDVRLRRVAEIRRAIVAAIRQALQNRSGGPPSPEPPENPGRSLWASEENPGAGTYGGTDPALTPGGRRTAHPFVTMPVDQAEGTAGGGFGIGEGASSSGEGSGFRYIGQTLGVFLAFEMDDALWLLDQHAAHERLIFDELSKGKPAVQDLLVPVSFASDNREEDDYIAANRDELLAAGFALEREGKNWEILSMPAILACSDASALIDLVRSRPDPSGLVRAANASVACRAAVKDGDELDAPAAVDLISRALDLPEKRCPHGRPIFVRHSREDLFRSVRRIVAR
ncbi:MAG: DNA mismatch repair endonuclease MutL [Spirochaetes bacterium]|nr:DNA mismatch repair endonuclease MutL [Spirochaetota bacterium]